ncbi:MAG: LamG domain-containing protein [Verrucomicrobiota bacterium]
MLANLNLAAGGNYDVVVSDLNLISVTSPVAVLNVMDRSPRYECLAGWWSGQGNANDALGLNDGTLQGGVLFANGIIGSASNPNGGYVDLGVGPALDSFTIETWIWVDPVQNVGEQRVISDDNYTLSGTRKGFLIKSTSAANTGQDGSPWLGISGPSGWQGLSAPQPLSAGWHHLAGVRDTVVSRLELYVDGALVASGALSVTDTIDSPVSTVLSGINPAVQSEPFHGRIDEPSIYAWALSLNQVAALYNRRPQLPAQSDRVIRELTTLVVTNTASDPGLPFNTLTYLKGGPTRRLSGRWRAMISSLA